MFDRHRRQFLRSACVGALTAVGILEFPAADCRGASPCRPTVRVPTAGEIRARSPGLWKLVDWINTYRLRKGLYKLPLSPSLSAVAAMHAFDLAESAPHVATGSLHSWSEGDRRWTGGPYRSGDKTTWPVMWEKPGQIAGYPAFGFEIAVAGADSMREAMVAWINSPPHHDLMLGRGIWQRLTWRGVGAVYFNGFACAWFGEEWEGPDERGGKV